MRGQEPDKPVPLGRRNVDEEIVGKIRRQLAAPVAVQVTTNDTEQQQNHNARSEGDDLHDTFGAATTQICNTIAPGDTNTASQPAGEIDEQRTGERQQCDEDSQTARKADEQPPVEHHPINQQDHHGDGRPKGQNHERLRRPDVAAEHAECRHT